MPLRQFFLNNQVIDIVEFRQQPLWKDPFFLKKKYLEERLSVPQIASLINCSKSSVIRGLELADIPIRPQYRAAPEGRPGKELLSKYREQNLKREAVAQRRISALKRDGYSAYQMAKILNEMNIPTVTGHGKWHAKTAIGLSKQLLS